MKKTLITTALLAVLGGAAPAAFAQADHSAHHGGASAASEADAKLAEGTVKKIDQSAGKLTIAHGPLESLGMPAMTMVFRAARAGPARSGQGGRQDPLRSREGRRCADGDRLSKLLSDACLAGASRSTLTIRPGEPLGG
jgi:Cu(I)/Ag(I) efflux system protein CusF